MTQRVYAVQSADDERVYLLGFGNYVGKEPRPGWDEGERQEYERMIRSIFPDETDDELAAELHSLSLNPKIELDNGGVVWGFQCWWADESRWEEFVAGREVIEMAIPNGLT